MRFSKLLCFVLLAVFIDKCYTCSPGPPRHPQTMFCQAKFAVKVKVLEQVPFEDEFYHKYKVRVQKIFKDEGKRPVKKVLRPGIQYLYTASQGAMCGGHLDVKEKYLVTGYYDTYNGRYTFNSNDWVAKWKDVTRIQRRGVKKRYLSSCDCEIARCENGFCNGKDLSADCQWAPGFFEDCWAQNGICIKTRKGCKWNRYTSKECGEMTIYAVGTPVTARPVTMA